MKPIGEPLLVAPAGHEVGRDRFAEGQARLPMIMVALSIEYVKTRRGAERILRAELAGRRRPEILARASRRLDDFDKRIIPRTSATAESKETIQ